MNPVVAYDAYQPVISRCILQGHDKITNLVSVYDFKITKVERLPPLDDLSLPEYED